MNCKTCQRVIVPDFLPTFAFSCTLHFLHYQIQSATMEPSPTSPTMVPSRISRHQSVSNMACVTRASKALAIERRTAAKLAIVATPPREIQLPIKQRIVALLKERREKAMGEGKIGRGILKELVQEHIIHFPWLTQNMVSHYMINYTDDNIVPLDIVTGMNNQKVVSGLTDASPVAMAMVAATVSTTPIDTTPTQESVSTSKRGGTPTGSTHGAIEGRKKLVADAVDECATEIASLKPLAMHVLYRVFN
jgi:hypothetical protein